MSFFSEAQHKFLPIPEDRRIGTKSFLDAASEIVPFFDVLGPKAFAPVKSDINGNIKKLREKYAQDPEKYKTLQGIVESEIEEKTTTSKNSATDALLWLKRAMQFIIIFLQEVLTGEPDLVKCAKKAYEGSLKRFHGWMVQGIFSLAMKAVPYRKDFIASLGRGKVDEETVLKEMKECVDLLAANIEVIEQFYQENDLDSSKPNFIFDASILSASAVTGQFFIYSLVKEFGALVLAATMNMRQVLSILTSYIKYSHPISFLQILSLCAVFASLFYKSYLSYLKGKQPKEPKTPGKAEAIGKASVEELQELKAEVPKEENENKN